MRVYTTVRVRNAKQVEQKLENMGDRSKNMKPVLRWAKRRLERDFSENFSTFGALSAKAMLKGAWPPLDTQYASWKAANYPGAPMMVQTGELRFRVTHPQVGMTDMNLVIAVPGDLAKWHQYGTRNMPQRPLVFVPRNFPNELKDKAAEYVTRGKLSASVA